jgi:predicted SnoaL-like aldol condensation-catalyzing enzyme
MSGGGRAPLVFAVALVSLAGCSPGGVTDQVAQNEALVARYYEEVFNQRNLDFLQEAMREDVVGHGPGFQDRVEGVEQVAAFSAYVYEVYEDYSLTVNELFGSGNLVQVRATVKAVHKPTGKPVEFFGLSIYRLEEGWIAEYWRAYDRLDLYDSQLGGWRPATD